MALIVALALAVIPPAASNKRAGPTTLRVRLLRFVDRSRTIRLPDGRNVPRRLDTTVDYPAQGGPYPLIVFAHGYALTPVTYDALLRTWARAGYVVAAPWFPLEKANAAGGPNESDLVNEPRDISFVLSSLLKLNDRTRGVLGGAIDPGRIAVAGHSDGGVAALAVAYDRRVRDRRVDAALVMSGAELSGMGAFPRAGPPLLAMQGTADRVNSPRTTASYFGLARPPKFLLWLLGAGHLPPYTVQEPQLRIVEASTTEFFDHYLKHLALARFERAATRPGLTRLIADP